MGCDIHLRVEKRGPEGWRPVEKMVPARYPDFEGEMEPERWFHQRNYDAFAILANVRNGRGFGGELTGEGFDPIAEPRGLPADLWDGYGEGDWFGDHSFSWVSARELVELDWSKTSTHRGLVTASTYHNWRQYDREEMRPPKMYCSSVSGAGVRILPSKEVDRLLDAMVERARAEVGAQSGWGQVFDRMLYGPDGRRDDFHGGRGELYGVYAECSWVEFYSESAGQLYTRLVPRLKKLAGEDLDSVRIVFGFDS